MASSQDAPIDEVQWSSAEWAQHFGGIHENTVLYYFARSPFCEPTSNNSSTETQAMYNPSMMYMLETRDLFEAHLRTLQGLEYMVVFSPKDFGPEAPIGQGTWVIRKQNRRKRPGLEDELTSLADYFVVGEHIYMAPSVNNIIQARMLSTILALNSLIAAATVLPLYTPALGHRYFLPTLKSQEPPFSSQSTQQSRESTPLSDGQIPAETQIKSSSITPASSTTSKDVSSTQALYDSFSQFLRYRNEYMDENPLLGEPGSFVFSSSKQQLQAQQDQASRRAEQQATIRLQTNIKRPDTPQQTSPSTPQQPKMDNLPVVKVSRIERKQINNGTVPKTKRRKSKAPPTPGSPLSATSFK